MKKDKLYFSHDAYAYDDPKMIHLIEVLGLEGAGIYWGLLQLLRLEEPHHSFPVNIALMKFRAWNTSADKIKAVILNFRLFEVDEDEMFFSHSFNRRMGIMGSKSEEMRQLALKRWGKKVDDDAEGCDTQCEPHAARNADRNATKLNQTKLNKQLIKEASDFLISDLKESDKEIYDMLIAKGLHADKALNCFNTPARRKLFYNWWADKSTGGVQRDYKTVEPRSEASKKFHYGLFAVMKNAGERI